ncbi:MAG: hypothetical protein LBD89_03420 [Tannerellaceae bacterium]|jgi:hypothetical protein|nr:hypothetical protein [Tannerellaceae bacterium]
MKKLLFLFTIVISLTYHSCKEDAYDNIREYVTSENIYPEKFDTISAAIGFERVELYLTKAGRSDSLMKKNPVKAKKTIVEYDDSTIIFEGMQPWVNIVNLTQPKLYRFRVYTIDEYGNKSVYQEIAKIPYTKSDRDAIRIAEPNTVLSPWGVKLWWPNGISTSMWELLECDYEYKDKDNNVINNTMDITTLNFDADNLSPGSETNLSFSIKIQPLVDGVPILDTVQFNQTIDVITPTPEEYGQFLKSREIEKWENDGEQMIIQWKVISDPTMTSSAITYTDYSNRSAPVEKTIEVSNDTERTPLPGLILQRVAISSSYEPVGGGGAIVDAQPTMATPPFSAPEAMQANGISANTDPMTVTSLRFPITTPSLMDVLYFPNLEEIDLSGETFGVPLQDVKGTSTIGGCPWNPSLRRIDLNEGTPRNLSGIQALSKVLSNGGIKKVRYNRGSMGTGIDAALSLYVSNGIVEIIPLPAEAFVLNNFCALGTIVTGSWRTENTYQPTDTPEGHGGATHVWKVIPRGASASFCFVYQKDYKFNIWDYRYLKMKVFTPDASYFYTDYYANFKRIWFRIRNSLWGNTPLVSWDTNNDEHNGGKEDFRATDAQLGKWRDITFDTWSIADRSSHPYANVLVINIGGEPGGTYAPTRDIVYYFADIRFSQTP